MRIADIDLGDKPLFLAPMEDVTDPSFRYVCKRFGADMVYTEFISSDGLIRDAAKSVAKLRTYDYERPVGIQLYGNEIEPMVEAARIAEAAQAGLVQVTYHLLVTLRRDYALYEESGLFAQLRQMTEEGAKRPDFLFDIPHIKRGAVVLTDAGRRALAQAE